MEVLDDVCSASPFGAADGTLVLLAREFQAGGAGQFGTAVVPVAGRCATEAAIADDWGLVTAPSAKLHSLVVELGALPPSRGTAHARILRQRSRLVHRMRAAVSASAASRTTGIFSVFCTFYGSNESSRAVLLPRLSRDDLDGTTGRHCG